MQHRAFIILAVILGCHAQNVEAHNLYFYKYDPTFVQAGWNLLDSKTISSEAFIFLKADNSYPGLQQSGGAVLSSTWFLANESAVEGIYYSVNLMRNNERVQTAGISGSYNSLWTHDQRLSFGAGQWQDLTTCLRIKMGVLISRRKPIY